ncbi:hypothetical protein VNO78_03279 [Psophocarpus tetragonolobus]|uniref:Uncharacterized protein n=1 Tax=Psophocarpus tetragonolobus TaxID=3891 RepID=A0AAN9TCX7_PSOTE
MGYKNKIPLLIYSALGPLLTQAESSIETLVPLPPCCRRDIRLRRSHLRPRPPLSLPSCALILSGTIAAPPHVFAIPEANGKAESEQ